MAALSWTSAPGLQLSYSRNKRMLTGQITCTQGDTVTVPLGVIESASAKLASSGADVLVPWSGSTLTLGTFAGTVGVNFNIIGR